MSMSMIESIEQKQGRIDRDIAFDLLLSKRETVSQFVKFAVIIIAMAMQTRLITEYTSLVGGFTKLVIPESINIVTITSVVMLAVALAWLCFAFFTARRRARLERDMMRAQINALKLQTLADQN